MRQTVSMQTWRLLRLGGWAATRPCQHCGLVHEYVSRPGRGSACQPVLLPPGVANPGLGGVAVEAFLADPTFLPDLDQDEAAYRRLARRVAERGIRCERCGARFEDLDRYAAHQC